MIFPQAARLGGRGAGAAWVLQNESPRNFSAGNSPFVPPSVTRIRAAFAGCRKINVSVAISPSSSFWRPALARWKLALSGDHKPQE